MNPATKDPVERLDRNHVRKAAAWAAEQLALTGVARVRLAPGDMTEYPIHVSAPSPEWPRQTDSPGRSYWVLLCSGFGAGYEWMGHEIHSDYAAQKWTNRGAPVGTRLYAGAAVGLYLTELSAAIRCRLDGHLRGPLVEHVPEGAALLCERCGGEFVHGRDGTVVPVGEVQA